MVFLARCKTAWLSISLIFVDVHNGQFFKYATKLETNHNIKHRCPSQFFSSLSAFCPKLLVPFLPAYS